MRFTPLFLEAHKSRPATNGPPPERRAWEAPYATMQASRGRVIKLYADEMLPALLGGTWRQMLTTITTPGDWPRTSRYLAGDHRVPFDHTLMFRRFGAKSRICWNNAVLVGQRYNALDCGGSVTAEARAHARFIVAKYGPGTWTRPRPKQLVPRRDVFGRGRLGSRDKQCTRIWLHRVGRGRQRMSTVLSQDRRIRLARLLGMLESAFEVKHAAAAAAAHRLIVTAGTTWKETILTAPAPVAQPQRESCRPKQPPRHDLVDDWRTTVSESLQHPHDLSEWELEFLSGLRRFLRLSLKQRTRLTEIADRALGE